MDFPTYAIIRIWVTITPKPRTHVCNKQGISCSLNPMSSHSTNTAILSVILLFWSQYESQNETLSRGDGRLHLCLLNVGDDVTRMRSFCPLSPVSGRMYHHQSITCVYLLRGQLQALVVPVPLVTISCLEDKQEKGLAAGHNPLSRRARLRSLWPSVSICSHPLCFMNNWIWGLFLFILKVHFTAL